MVGSCWGGSTRRANRPSATPRLSPRAMTRSDDLRALARQVADALPVDVAEEIVLTGSVSRGAADEASDIEMLVVSREAVELARCFAFAEHAGLVHLGTWGPQGGPAQRVSGYVDRVPVELVW